MRSIALLLLWSLVACATTEEPAAAVPEMEGWRLASGKSPTQAEFVAVLAACQNQAVPRSRGRPLDACLGDLGLRRTP